LFAIPAWSRNVGEEKGYQEMYLLEISLCFRGKGRGKI
jgi:hypothetical protein